MSMACVYRRPIETSVISESIGHAFEFNFGAIRVTLSRAASLEAAELQVTLLARDSPT